MAGGEFFGLLSTGKEFQAKRSNVLSPSSFKILLCLTDCHITGQSAQNVSSAGFCDLSLLCAAVGSSETGPSASGKRKVLGRSTSPKILMQPVLKYSSII